MDVGLSIWLPDGDLGEYRSVKEQREMVDTELEVGAVRYEMLEALQSWRLTMEGEVRPGPACAPAPSPPPADPRPPTRPRRPGRARRPLRRRHPRHRHRRTGWERAEVGGGRRGGGHRRQGPPRAGRPLDRHPRRGRHEPSSGGARTATATVPGARAAGVVPKMWRWFSINVGEDTHFGGIRLGTGAGDLHRGWVWHEGRATSVAEWRVRTELADDGVTHRVVHLDVVDKSGRTHPLRGEVMRVADIGQAGGTMVNEGLARWTYADPAGPERAGYGICEYLHQLDAAGRPVVPVE